MVFVCLAIVLHFFVASSGETISIVISSDEPCSGEFHCSTLQQYVFNPSQGVNITLQMQSGNHTLNSELTVTNINNFTMIGSNARVMCSSTAAQITLTSVQHVRITGVTFIGCQYNTLSNGGESIEIRNAVFNQNIRNIVDSVNTLIVENTEFDRNSRTGLDLRSFVTSATIERSIFSNNGARGITAVSANVEISHSIFYRNTGSRGGCIYAQTSTVTISVSNFTECRSVGGYDGGAIDGERVTFTITGTNFTQNQGYGGGALSGSYSSFNITSSNFIGNIGTHRGGAIRGGIGTSFFAVADSNFISNTGSTGGGFDTDLLNSVTSCNFVNNRATFGNGGGIEAGSRSVVISHSRFHNNTAQYHGGGVILNMGSTNNADVSIVASTFLNNTASQGHGGGLHCHSSGQNAMVTLTDSVLQGNTASSPIESSQNTINGGGVYVSGANSLISILTSEISLNSASGSGGGVYISGSVIINASNFAANFALLGKGGAIQSNGQNANVMFTKSVFSYNSASSCGVLDLNQRSQEVAVVDCLLIHNLANGEESGGGVFCIKSSLTSIQNSNISHNSANVNGGVFFISEGALHTTESNFINNSASRSGGVVYSFGELPSYHFLQSTFSENQAGTVGGVLAISGQGDGDIQIDDSLFTYNNANYRGGAISVNRSSIIFNDTSTHNNTADKGGDLSACNTHVLVYDNQELIQADTARDTICSLYDDISSSGVHEEISVTAQPTCNDCVFILTSSDNFCPGESIGEPCFTLQQYIGNPSNDPNITIVLEDGNHTISGELRATNAYNLTITSNNARIMCTSTAAQLNLDSVQHVTISGVSFIGCQYNTISRNGESVIIRNAMFNQNIRNIVDSVNTLIVENTTFDRNSRTALDLRNYVMSATIERSVFSNNGYRGIAAVSAYLEISQSTFYRNTGSRGGCIYVQTSTVTISVSNFTECRSVGGYDGGAIDGVRVTFTITGTNFTQNQGYGGGALSGSYSSFNITSSNFIGNIGTHRGGAIRGGIGTSFFAVADSNFISNTGSTGGGLDTDLLNSVTSCNFVNNRATFGNGGGIEAGSRSVVISHSRFHNNTAQYHGGGVILNMGSTNNVNVSIVTSTFLNNTASQGHGGGLHCHSSGQNAMVTVIDSVFHSNTATTPHESSRNTINGGGVYVSGANSSISILTSEISLNSASGNGGGVYISGSVIVNASNFTANSAILGEGGAIQSNRQNANTTLMGSVFEYNSAFSCGVLDVNDRFHAITFEECWFLHNMATGMDTGGGVCCIRSASVSVINSCIHHNSARFNGGVFYIDEAVVNIERSNFMNNSASQSGAVVYTYVHPVSYSIVESMFSNNAASGDGGVMFIGRQGSILQIEESVFSNNSASNRGGVIAIIGSTIILNDTFIYGSSADKGEIISACNSIVSVYENGNHVQTDTSSKVCTLFDDVNTPGVNEQINGTSSSPPSTCSECTVFIIIASSGDYCPGEFTGEPCLTLQQYVGNPSYDSNITLLFETGNHTLGRELRTTNAYSFTLTGENVHIMCTSTAAQLYFDSIQHVQLSGVSLIGCQYNTISRNGESVIIRNAMFNQNIRNIVDSIDTLIVENTVFDRNSRTALDLRNYVTSATIERSVFSNNGYRGIAAVSAYLEISQSTFYRNTGSRGGCIYVQTSTVTISVSNFTECRSVGGYDGGAIDGVRVTFTITGTNFTQNQGYGGGALSGSYSSFNITSSNFIGNIGTHRGGAIRGGIGTSFFAVADSSFISNTGNTGGGFDTDLLNSVTCCSFINNRAIFGNGGGIDAGSRSVVISHSRFYNNTAQYHGGGVILNAGSANNVDISIVATTFLNNTASQGHGGGLHCHSRGQNATIKITESSFQHNTATTPHESSRNTINGGGVYMDSNNGHLYIQASDLSSNFASGRGGAISATCSISINESIFFNNTALTGDGGGVHSSQQDSNVSIFHSTFSHNTALSCGVLTVQGNNRTVRFIESFFVYNRVTDNVNGGGVTCIHSASILMENCNFYHNSANFHGGVLRMYDSSLNIEGSLFFNNSASQDGGVIYSDTALQNTADINQCTFIENAAGSDGGALFIGNSVSQFSISESTFSNNTAASRGGAIFTIQSVVQINQTNIYDNFAELGDAINSCNSMITIIGAEVSLSTDPSNTACTLYGGNVKHFTEITPHGVEELTNITPTPFVVTCPFQYETPINALPTTTLISTTVETTEAITTISASSTTGTAETITTTGENADTIAPTTDTVDSLTTTTPESTDIVTTTATAGEQSTGNVDHNETTFTTMFTDEIGTSTESSTESGFLSLSTAEIGGIGAAGSLLFLVLLCILIACFCYYRQKRMNKLMLVEKQHIVNQFILKDMQEDSNPYLKRGKLAMRKVTSSESIRRKLVLSGQDLRLLDILGEGEFSYVYKAHLLKPLVIMHQTDDIELNTSLNLSQSFQTTTVAVKTLKGSFTDNNIMELLRENVLMYKFNHPNVLPLVGICLDAGPSPYIVLPYMENGSLLSYVKKNRCSLLTSNETDEEEIHIARKRLSDMCLQIAKGMEYLAKMKLIHRDLAARNCMIDGNWIIKVADFGLSDTISSSKDYIRQNQDVEVKLPAKWMAPESLYESIYSEKSDVWAYGITCWEVFTTGATPYPGLHPMSVIKQLNSGLRLEKPDNTACSDEMYIMMKNCWEHDPELRPSFSELVKDIGSELEGMSEYLCISTFNSEKLGI